MFFVSVLFATTALAVPVDPEIEDLDLEANKNQQIQQIQEIVIDDSVEDLDFDFLDENESES